MKGTISVNTENIFPIIKKSLYSNQEVFLRELVSNAVDASQKMKALANMGQFSGELGELFIEIQVDESAKTLSIIDRGLGMTAEEINKYINQVAFSGATEFMEQYKDKLSEETMIGAFGLGFYSAFMVASKVTIDTLSYQEGSKPAFWSCDGSTEFEISEGSRTERGTTITLHIAEDAEEYLQNSRIQEILQKYCLFLPVPVHFGTEKVTEGEGDTKTEIEKPVIVNQATPIWTKKPNELSDEDYLKFYDVLFPFHEKPLFWIHLNVDFPFNLTGVLYFPKFKPDFDPNKNKIRLFSNQVFITDSVEEIVPDFMRLLHGVIDSPDIPLNVSRSFLQTDGNVKKITAHITKKISDKLGELFKNDRSGFEEKWADLDVFIKYGMLTEEKFAEKAKDFLLVKDSEGKLYDWDTYQNLIAGNQTDKDGNTIVLYYANRDQQAAFLQQAAARSLSVLEFGHAIDPHIIGHLEMKLEKVRFKRIDSEPIDQLIDKGESMPALLNEEEANKIKTLIESISSNDKSLVFKTEAGGIDGLPFTITMNEFMRRMHDMEALGGKSMFGNMPLMHDVIINTAHPITKKISDLSDATEQENQLKYVLDLAKMAQGMLRGDELTKFIKSALERV
jgi:molecular chaperone HtpG